MMPTLHEATLQLALASIPVSATLIHPALGIGASVATLYTLARLIHRGRGQQSTVNH